MGQPIPPEVREKLQRHPHVRSITDQHLILRGGKIADPGSFVVEERRARFVVKLTHCPSHSHGFFTTTKHTQGEHQIVGGMVRLFGTGQTHNLPHLPTFCEGGQWVVEEVLPA